MEVDYLLENVIINIVKLLFNWLISALVILSVPYILPGVHVQSFTVALVVALVLGIINAFLRPLLLFLTLPLNILTFGLFTLVINAVLIMLTGSLVSGFVVDNFWWALLFGLALSVINTFLRKISR